MKDVGESRANTDIPVSYKEKGKYYPHIDLDSKAFSEIDDMKVGGKYVLTIEVKPIRMSQSEDSDGKRTSMCFEVRKIGLNGDSDEDMEGDEKVNKMVDKMYAKK